MIYLTSIFITQVKTVFFGDLNSTSNNFGEKLNYSLKLSDT